VGEAGRAREGSKVELDRIELTSSSFLPL